MFQTYQTRPNKKLYDYSKGVTIFTSINLNDNIEAFNQILQLVDATYLAKEPWIPNDFPFCIKFIATTNDQKDKFIKSINQNRHSIQTCKLIAVEMNGNMGDFSVVNDKVLKTDIMSLITSFIAASISSPDIITHISFAKTESAVHYRMYLNLSNKDSMDKIINDVQGFKRYKSYIQLAQENRFEMFMNLTNDFEEKYIKQIIKETNEKINFKIKSTSCKTEVKTSPYNPSENYQQLSIKLQDDKQVEQLLKTVIAIRTPKNRIITKSFKSRAHWYEQRMNRNTTNERQEYNFSNNSTAKVADLESRVTIIENKMNHMQTSLDKIADMVDIIAEKYQIH